MTGRHAVLFAEAKRLLPGAEPCPRCGRVTYPWKAGMATSWSRVGRGLCGYCHSQLTPDQRMDYPRRNQSQDDVMAEWELLRSEGYTKQQAADRLGMTFAAFDRQFHRARRAGDPRALPALGTLRRVA